MHHHQQQQQQQQQSPQMFNTPPPQSQPGTLVTTEQIQKYLEENKQLILAIMENQNSGKTNDLAQYQAQLQKNLMYLAAVADAQPPEPTGPSQPQATPPPPPASNPQGAVMQPPQPAISQQQAGSFGSRQPFTVQSLDQQQLPPHVQQQQQSMSMGMRMGGNNAFHPAMQAAFGSATRLMDVHGRRDGSEPGFADAQAQGKSSGQGGSQ